MLTQIYHWVENKGWSNNKDDTCVTVHEIYRRI